MSIKAMISLVGLGLTLLTEIICMCCPDTIVKLDSPSSTMPNLTLAWLAEQPVFLPYRVRFEVKRRSLIIISK